MLTLRPTKVLAKRLSLPTPSVVPPVKNRVADWCVQGFRVARYRYLLFCNTASLYPLVTYGRGVTDDASLIDCAIDVMKNSLIGTKLEFQFQRWIVPELGVVQWAPIPDRTIMGSMNDMIRMAKYHLTYDEDSPLEGSPKLAEAPMGMLGMKSPKKVFRQLRGPE